MGADEGAESISDSARTVDPPAPVRRLARARQGRVVAGVARGLADHLMLPVTPVRVGLVVLCLFSGFGALLYVILWVLVRPQATARDAPRDAGDLGVPLVVGALVVGGIVLLTFAGFRPVNQVIWPAAAIGVGAALLWRQADDARRARWAAQTSGKISWLLGADQAGRSASAARLVVGGVLVAAGAAASLAVSGQLNAARQGLASTVVVLLGIAVITGPWWWRLIGDLSAERRERIRSQERAEMAAHLHDSVLQTLALIQRQADSPREVVRLARGQERELRTWLYRPGDAGAARFAAALRAAAAEVEDAYGIAVDAVVVADAALDARMEALVQAAREALVNAAKHAGVGEVSLYAEVAPGEATVFVRDRGAGFDPESVPADRHGLSGSVVGRMSRHGGSAIVRSEPGAGTEVELSMPVETGP